MTASRLAQAGLGFALALAGGAAAAGERADVLYEALYGEPVAVEGRDLLSGPGRFVGRAVRTQGRLERAKGDATAFAIAVASGRAGLRLEPQAAAALASRGAGWLSRTVEVEGLFYRDATQDAYALRVWRVELQGAARTAGTAAHDESGAPLVSLEQLVYSAGRYDGKLVRVRGAHRGTNVHHDLPDASRRGARDWVLKAGYFAAWVGGREAGLGEAGADADVLLEVVGIPETRDGVVRVAARSVAASEAAPVAVVGRALPTGDAGWAAVPPHVSFVLPGPGEALRPRGHVILQFNKPMDPSRFEASIRMRYERDGAVTARPRLGLDYRDRYRALVLTPDPPPPAGVDVVVEILEGLVDVDGRGLVPEAEPLRFRSGR